MIESNHMQEWLCASSPGLRGQPIKHSRTPPSPLSWPAIYGKNVNFQAFPTENNHKYLEQLGYLPLTRATMASNSLKSPSPLPVLLCRVSTVAVAVAVDAAAAAAAAAPTREGI